MRLSLHCGSDQICRYLKNWPAGRSPGSKLKEIIRIVFRRIGNGPGANTSASLIAGFENTLFLQSTHGENKTTLPTIQTMASDLGYTEPPWFRSTSEPVVMRRRQTIQKHIYFIIWSIRGFCGYWVSAGSFSRRVLVLPSHAAKRIGLQTKSRRDFPSTQVGKYFRPA